jgi:hypothetical protein|tara:strand:- start:2810 stop:2992 length:183 start_codon:yes stop_codon:yes gene_type:complete
MLYHNSLDEYFETNFALLQYHNWSLTEIENLMPWERQIYINYLMNYLEKQRLEVAQAQNA